VIFARVLLGEKSGPTGYLVIALSLAGAIVMLWRPGAQIPLRHTSAEWLGLSSGMAFAASNVLSRKARQADVRIKSLAVWAGVSLVSLPVIILTDDPLRSVHALDAWAWLVLLLVAVAIFTVNPVIQYGLAHTLANRAVVIFLSELVFAAAAPHFLAFEKMNWQQWLGGAMVVTATLYSGRREPAAEKSAQA
jgi:drug/metabolite transporter (DMT)-like permease